MDFQAVVMAAGNGSRMRELTSSVPKCLLPVGNVPLILCSLNALRRAGILEAIVVVRENEKTKIQNAIENKLENMKLDFATVPKNEDWGTADSLRHIKDKIKSGILVFSCDVVTDIDLSGLLNFHRSHSASLTVLLVPAMKSLQEIDVPGSKKKNKQERDIVGLDSTGRLMFVNSETDFEDGVPIKLSLLKRYPQIKVHSNLMDAHVYMISKDLVSFIVNNENLSTIKGEFLPAAVKKQFAFKLATVPARDITNDELPDLMKLALEMSSCDNQDINCCSEDEIRCYSYVERNSLCSRINTIVAYADINRKISKNFTTITGLSPKEHQFQKSQVDFDSNVGDNCELLTKSSVKHSSIGTGCTLNEKAKVTSCIVMDNVTIGRECNVQGSIICNNVSIGDNCDVKNSIIGPDQALKENSKFVNEILQCADQLMEI